MSDKEREANRLLQAIRESHCDRADEVDHRCVGQLTIKPEGYCLDCKLCGSLEATQTEPRYDERTAFGFIKLVTENIGVNWDVLSGEVQIDTLKRASQWLERFRKKHAR